MKKAIGPAFSDERGDIVDVVVKDEIHHVNVITFKKGAIRGNHYHLETVQKNFLLDGELEYLERDVTGKEVSGCIMSPGDMTVSLPGKIHAFIAKQDSRLLVLTTGPRGGNDYENDTYREVIS